MTAGATVLESADYDPWGLGGRWGSVDPLAEGTPEWSSYVYVHNAPVRRVDPLGLCEPWPSCANAFWENVAVSGHRRGGFLGTLTATVATGMSTLLKYSGVNDADRGLDLIAGGQVVQGVGLVGLAVVGNVPGGRAVGKVDDVVEAVGDAVSGARQLRGGPQSRVDALRGAGRIGDDAARGLLPQVSVGPGMAPRSARDPQRFFTPAQRQAKRAEQGNLCGNGCGTTIDESNSAGHHIRRHADGGKTVPENHAEVCTTCHAEIHTRRPDQ